MAEKIAIQIELQGGAEVEKQLAAIGEAGEKAFGQINKAAAQVEIEKVGEASQTAAEGMDQVGKASEQAGAEISKTHEAVNEVIGAFAQLVQATAKVVADHETLIRSLIRLHGAFSTTSRVLAALTPELGLVGVTVGSTAAAVAAGVVAFEALEKVVTKVAAGDEKLNQTLQTLAATSGKSFDELQRGEAAFGQIGIKAETFRGTIAKVQETLAGTEVSNLTKGMKDVVELVNQIAAGDKGITFANWVTAEDKIKGVAVAMKQAADSGKDATQVLLEFLRNADLATSIKVGAAFGLSEADVDRVRRLNENISDLTQRIKGAGVLISPEAAANFDRMRTSIQNADSAWARLKQSIDSTIFPSLAASFSATMHEMETAAVNGVARIIEQLNQAGRAMATPPPGVTAFFQAFGQAAQQAVGVANSAIADFVGGLMRGMGASEQAIKAVQDQINGVAQAANAAGQAAQTAGVMFTQWGSMAQQGANTAQAAVQETATMFTSFGTVAADAGAKGKQAGETAASGWDITSAAIQRAIDKFLVWIGLKSPSNAPTGEAAAGKARGGMIGGLGTGTSDSNLAWLSRGEFVVRAASVRKYGASLFAALNAQRFAAGGSVGGGGELWQFLNTVTDQLDQALRALNPGLVDNVLRIAKSVELPMQALLGLMSKISGKARGGLLGGRGTGTSDSNLAWVSRGEYVTPARAVAQPGVLAFLEALRRSGGNLRSVLDGMGRFALGGMIPRPAMAFAAGGMAGMGPHHRDLGMLTLVTANGIVSGLTDAKIAEALGRVAVKGQVRSGGRKPSRYS